MHALSSARTRGYTTFYLVAEERAERCCRGCTLTGSHGGGRLRVKWLLCGSLSASAIYRRTCETRDLSISGRADLRALLKLSLSVEEQTRADCHGQQCALFLDGRTAAHDGCHLLLIIANQPISVSSTCNKTDQNATQIIKQVKAKTGTWKRVE